MSPRLSLPVLAGLGAGLFVMGLIFPRARSEAAPSPTRNTPQSPLLIEIDSRPGEGWGEIIPHRPATVASLRLGGESITFDALVKQVLALRGPLRDVSTDKEAPTPHPRRVLIRSAGDEAFAYAKLIIDRFAEPDINLRRIGLTLAGEDDAPRPHQRPLDPPGLTRPTARLALSQEFGGNARTPLPRRDTRYSWNSQRLRDVSPEWTVRHEIRRRALEFRHDYVDGVVILDVYAGVPFRRVLAAIDLLREAKVPAYRIEPESARRGRETPRTWAGLEEAIRLEKGAYDHSHSYRSGYRSTLIMKAGFGWRRRGRKKSHRGAARPAALAVGYAHDALRARQKAKSGWHEGDNLDVPATALGALTLVGAGETHLSGRAKKSVRSALWALKTRYRTSGRFSPDEEADLLATMLTVEAYAMTSSPVFKKPAENGVDRLIANLERPHRLRLDPARDAVWAAWAVNLLYAAHCADVRDAGEALSRLRRRLEETRPKADAKISTDDRLLFDIATLLAGRFDLTDPIPAPAFRERVTKRLAGVRPVIDRHAPVVLLFTSMAAHQVGGPFWSEWVATMEASLVAAQIQDEEDPNHGRWLAPKKIPSTTIDDLRRTALLTLCLESRYRYGRIMDAK